MSLSLLGPSLAVAGHAARALSAYRTLREVPAEADALFGAMRALEGPLLVASALHARERTAGVVDGALALARAALADAEALLAGDRPTDGGAGVDDSDADGGDDGDDGIADDGARGWVPWLERAIGGVRRRDALPKARAQLLEAGAALSLAFGVLGALYGPLAPPDPRAPFALEPSALETARELATELEAGRRFRLVLGVGECFALLGSTVKRAGGAHGAGAGAERAWSAHGRHALLLELIEPPSQHETTAPSNARAAGVPASAGWQLTLRPIGGDGDGDCDHGEDGGGAGGGVTDASPALAVLRALAREPLAMLPLRAAALVVSRRPLAVSGVPAHGVSRALPASLAAATPTYVFSAAEPGSGAAGAGGAGGRAPIGRARGAGASAFALVFETAAPPSGVGADAAERGAGARWPFAGGRWISAETVDALFALALAFADGERARADVESHDGRRAMLRALRAIGAYDDDPEDGDDGESGAGGAGGRAADGAARATSAVRSVSMAVSMAAEHAPRTPVPAERARGEARSESVGATYASHGPERCAGAGAARDARGGVAAAARAAEGAAREAVDADAAGEALGTRLGAVRLG
ncbi:hypothetical protein KFE25_012824 [Diacronema lutheri]|uniref:Uncharacterized protein n=1 Tax=Diacronema lutheri TaxID=2081491 RepID=A0A8J6C3P1_DIALT|nr:hypothetical protein KFE25_012824 [Diacronema lutheri]